MVGAETDGGKFIEHLEHMVHALKCRKKCRGPFCRSGNTTGERIVGRTELFKKCK